MRSNLQTNLSHFLCTSISNFSVFNKGQLKKADKKVDKMSEVEFFEADPIGKKSSEEETEEGDSSYFLSYEGASVCRSK